MHCSESLPFFRKQCTSVLSQGLCPAWGHKDDIVHGYPLCGSPLEEGAGASSTVVEAAKDLGQRLAPEGGQGGQGCSGKTGPS